MDLFLCLLLFTLKEFCLVVGVAGVVGLVFLWVFYFGLTYEVMDLIFTQVKAHKGS